MGQGISKDPRTNFLNNWKVVQEAIKQNNNSPQLITAVNTWFAKYEQMAPKVDILTNKASITDDDTIDFEEIGKVDGLYKSIIDSEKLLNGLDKGPETFRQFRKNYLYEMNIDLKTKFNEIKRRGPKQLQPAYIPPPELNSLQAKLDILKAQGKGGRRKTRSKRRHRKTRR